MSATKPRPTNLKEMLRFGFKTLRAQREWLAEQTKVDVATVIRWEKGEEPIPDRLIQPLADYLAVSVVCLMGWDDAPRSEIPEQWRTVIAEDSAERAESMIPGECESLIRSIEWRLSVDEDLLEDSPIVPRLRRLRMAVLEFLAEPCDMEDDR
jgi:transcriptional regulator with XRE-family HTH domain